MNVIQVVNVTHVGAKPNSTVKLRLNKSSLMYSMQTSGTGDLPVAVVSVTGRKSGGKSFLLDFFLRYAVHKYQNADGDVNWLGYEDKPLVGFPWNRTQTSGILLWPEFFVTTSHGKKVCILLMDTQGSYEDKSRSQESAGILALTSLVSSLQIFNVHKRIDDSDLSHLESYCFFSKTLTKENFQKLLFVVRDWRSFNSKYGYEGGGEYFDEAVLGNVKEPERLKTRRNVVSYFDEVSCFLMPDPGLRAKNRPSFQGMLREIDKDFLEQLQILVPSVLAPENLILKRVNNETVTTKQLFSYMDQWVSTFNQSYLPAMFTMPNTTAELKLLRLKSEAYKLYEECMKNLIALEEKKYIQAATLQEFHEDSFERAMNFFNVSSQSAEAPNAVTECKTSLISRIEKSYRARKIMNEYNNPHTFLVVSIPLICFPVILVMLLIDYLNLATSTVPYYLTIYTFWFGVLGLCYWAYVLYLVNTTPVERLVVNTAVWLMFFTVGNRIVTNKSKHLLDAIHWAFGQHQDNRRISN